MLVVIDIDGTIADAAERVQLAGPEPDRSNRDVYSRWVSKINAGMEYDGPVKGMRMFCHSLADKNCLIYVTNREESHRAVTEDWLQKNGFPMCELHMRPVEDWRSSGDLKEYIINSVYSPFHKSVIVVDDDERSDIAEICKRNGWTFLKAMSGR